MRATHLIHGIIETGEVRKSHRREVQDSRVAMLEEVLERALKPSLRSGLELVDGWAIAAQASYPGGRLAIQLYAPGTNTAGPPAASMSVSYDSGRPPSVWTSRTGIDLLPFPWRLAAAAEVDNLELGLAWAWIPLIESWVEDDWARTLASLGLHCEGEEGSSEEAWHEEPEGPEREDWPEEEDWRQRSGHRLEADWDDEYPETDEGPAVWGWDDPWDWAPVDVVEDWQQV